jgi:hypothetical protein
VEVLVGTLMLILFLPFVAVLYVVFRVARSGVVWASRRFGDYAPDRDERYYVEFGDGFD